MEYYAHKANLLIAAFCLMPNREMSLANTFKPVIHSG